MIPGTIVSALGMVGTKIARHARLFFLAMFLVFAPLGFIWALNVLFYLKIPFDLFTWLASALFVSLPVGTVLVIRGWWR